MTGALEAVDGILGPGYRSRDSGVTNGGAGWLGTFETGSYCDLFVVCQC